MESTCPAVLSRVIIRSADTTMGDTNLNIGFFEGLQVVLPPHQILFTNGLFGDPAFKLGC